MVLGTTKQKIIIKINYLPASSKSINSHDTKMNYGHIIKKKIIENQDFNKLSHLQK